MSLILSSIRKRLNRNLSLEYDVQFQKGMNILFGRSGAGKSSTLKMILGQLSPDGGRITFRNRTLLDISQKVNMPIHERRIGLVPQNSLIFPHMTVRQNIAYGARSKIDVNDLLARFQMSHLKDRLSHQLSGGEQQRVALLRALASEPEILLFDEPLASIDEHTRHVYIKELQNLKEAYDFPMIYVTHNIAEAISIGDYVFIIDDGKVVQQGIPIDVFSKPKSQILTRLLGTENILECEVIETHPKDGVTIVQNNRIHLEIHTIEAEIGDRINMAIRAEDIIISQHPIKTSARNVVEAVVLKLPTSDYNELVADAQGTLFRIKITAKSIAELNIRKNGKIYLLIKAWSCYILN